VLSGDGGVELEWALEFVRLAGIGG
jgi:hypothetical protein